MRIHAVIVSFNGKPWLRDCLDSLRAQGMPVKVRLVDNNSSDGTADFVAEQYPEVQLTRLQQNLGFGAGNNIGIAAALREGAELVLLLNQDAIALEGSLDTLVAFMGRHPGFGCCAPLHCSADGSRPDAKTLRNYLARYAADYLADAVGNQVRTHYQVHGVNAAAWLVRAECFRQVGGFDPLFFMYGEDDDLLDRMVHHGVAFALVPGARMVHLRQSPVAAAVVGRLARVQRMALWEHSRLLLLCKKPGHTMRYIVVSLLLRGVVEPLLDFSFDHDTVRLAARWLAAAQLLARSAVLARHARTIAQSGPHFLD